MAADIELELNPDLQAEQEVRDTIWGVVGARDLLVDYPAQAESAHMAIIVERAVESLMELIKERENGRRN